MKLRFERAEGDSREVDLTTMAVTVGREHDNTVVLAERTVSRHHCSFVLTEHGEVIVEDTSSRYGTCLNGKTLTDSRTLVPGDVVRIGEWSAEVFDDTVVADEQLPGEEESAHDSRIPPDLEEERETTKIKLLPANSAEKQNSHQVMLALLAAAGFGGLLVFIYLLMGLHG
jgi:pSer/pThr/pTyr-binding forkhead associated (FHA) protein